jgi:hypothetical protein
MKLNQKPLIWFLWAIFSGILIVALIWKLQGEPTTTDQQLFMPGPLTDGHHQLVDNCNVCHGGPFEDKQKLQEACVNCHGDDRKKPMDSHPRNKFTDPRNADTLENIDALHCITCHTEHRPAATLANGVTQPADVCFHCHKDVGEDRPSHKDMAFNTCKTSGCHNFHNNRALYTDFLVKHLNKPDLKDNGKLPMREFSEVLEEIIEYPRDKYPVEAITAIRHADAPPEKLTAGLSHEWLDSSHANKGANCSACHVYTQTNAATAEAIWHDQPDEQGCVACHSLEVDRYKRGKHGMRLNADLPAMQVADARLSMKSGSGHKQLGCNSCHKAHKFDSRKAAVDGCLACHADEHSLAYKDSPHAGLWEKEMSSELTAGEGVSCASCHMPRINYDVNEWMSRIMVEHNQNATLSPNSKMIRPACLHCHGLEFSINSLADKNLIKNNFSGQPVFRTDSMRLAEEDLKRAEAEIESAVTE